MIENEVEDEGEDVVGEEIEIEQKRLLKEVVE